MREDVSHAEFARFVAEAQEQRDRATAAEAALAELRACFDAERFKDGTWALAVRAGRWDRLGEILCADPATRGSAILAAAREMLAYVVEVTETYLPYQSVRGPEVPSETLKHWRALVGDGEEA